MAIYKSAKDIFSEAFYHSLSLEEIFIIFSQISAFILSYLHIYARAFVFIVLFL